MTFRIDVDSHQKKQRFIVTILIVRINEKQNNLLVFGNILLHCNLNSQNRQKILKVIHRYPVVPVSCTVIFFQLGVVYNHEFKLHFSSVDFSVTAVF